MYALDISDPDSPSYLWGVDFNTIGFSEMGQTWSVPVVTIIPGYTDGFGVPKPVIIFGAGYDVNKDATGVISRDYYVRNVVAQAGADAFRVTEESSRTDSTRLVELYNCASALDKLAPAMARLESRSAVNSLAE